MQLAALKDTISHESNARRSAPMQRVSRRRDVIALILLITLGALVRLDFMSATQFTIDGDEAIVGLMGKHILEGRGIPTFYYGQHYMGSLEAIMASFYFLLFGSSPLTLQLVPVTWSLALIPIVYLLGKSVKGPGAGLVAALLTALPPPALIIWSTKARGGFIEIVVIGSLALLCAVRWLQTSPGRLRYPLVIGLLLGLGWWVNNQIAYFIAPIGIFSLYHLFSPDGHTRLSLRNWLTRTVKIAVTGVAAFLCGGVPYWIYNIRRNFPSAGMFGISTWDQFREHLRGFWDTALPILLGAQRFWHKEATFRGAESIACLLYLLPIVVLMIARTPSILRLLLGRPDRRQPIELVLLFSVSCCLIFAISSYGWLVQAPRYLLPMYVGIFLLVGIAAEYLAQRSQLAGALLVVALVIFNGATAYGKGRAVSGEPVVFAGQRVARSHTALVEALDKLGITRIRTNYWIGYRLAFETGEKITFAMLGEPTQVRIPEYQDSGGVPHRLLPLVLVPSEVTIVKPALKRLGISFQEASAGDYRILYNLQEVFAAAPELPISTIAKVQASVGSAPENAIDGKIDTRWGTSAPQSPGQSFRIDLAAPVQVAGFQYDIGRWSNDMPKALSLEFVRKNGERTQLLTDREYQGIRHLSWNEESFVMHFPEMDTQAIILTQTGRDQIFDWSIADIHLSGSESPLGDTRK